MEKQYVLIVDFGNPNNQLIAGRVRNKDVYCEVKSYTITIDEIKELNPVGIILTGGSREDILHLDIPTLEIETDVDDETLGDFLYKQCGCVGDWTINKFIDFQLEDIKKIAKASL